MADTPQSYAFGDFIFVRGTMQLTRQGQPLRITRQSAEVLKYLLDNRDRVVTRTELIDTFWASAPIGANDRLNTCIRRIRAAIDAPDATESMIETHPRVGYRMSPNAVAGRSSFGIPVQWTKGGNGQHEYRPGLLITACAMLTALPLLLFSSTAQHMPVLVHEGPGYELQRYGHLSSTCQFDRGGDLGECIFVGTGHVRLIHEGVEILRTDVPEGATLISSHRAGRIRFKLMGPHI